MIYKQATLKDISNIKKSFMYDESDPTDVVHKNMKTAIDIGMRARVLEAFPNISVKDLQDPEVVYPLYWSTVDKERFDKVDKVYPKFTAAIGGILGGTTAYDSAKKGKVYKSILGAAAGSGAGYVIGKTLVPILRKINEERQQENLRNPSDKVKHYLQEKGR